MIGSLGMILTVKRFTGDTPLNSDIMNFTSEIVYIPPAAVVLVYPPAQRAMIDDDVIDWVFSPKQVHCINVKRVRVAGQVPRSETHPSDDDIVGFDPDRLICGCETSSRRCLTGDGKVRIIYDDGTLQEDGP